MILSADQLKSLGQGEPIPVKIDDQECVVVPKDVFERMKEFADDDSDPAPRETYAAVLQAIDKDDDNTDQYLDYVKDS